MADEMFRPPINRSMRVLDRSFFRKDVPLKAARVLDNKNISVVRTRLVASKDVLRWTSVPSVRTDPDPVRAAANGKIILLRPETVIPFDKDGHLRKELKRAEEKPTSWPHSPVVKEFVDQGLIQTIPYTLQLRYDDWDYQEIMTAILPEEILEELPHGYTLVGQVAHLNLRPHALPYKDVVAEVLIDKNPGVRTVINKIDDVGGDSEFRTFKHEVLRGPDDLQVAVMHAGCVFKFDYSKVYWNPRLNTEHGRLLSMFHEGEAVCDVMAGIGPFAVPAGKKKVFVWANDLNPDSFASLSTAIKTNKVHPFVKAFNADGRAFIRDAIAGLAQQDHVARLTEKLSRGASPSRKPKVALHPCPRTFGHFVMNLPATALEFLPSFVGSYTSEVCTALLEAGISEIQLPLIHVYCFSTKSADNVAEAGKIAMEISGQIGHEIRPGKIAERGVEVHDVRDVAPNKRMFCASFRLPADTAFYGVPERRWTESGKGKVRLRK